MKRILLAIIMLCVFSLPMLAYGQTFSAQLAWDRSTSPEVINYRIYFSTESGYPKYNYIELGDVATGTVGGLTQGTTYYFVVTALNHYGYESSPSNEVWTDGIYIPGQPGIPNTPSGLYIITISSE